MRAIIHVELKSGIRDPQGRAVADTLQRMGYEEVTGVRVGKVIELELGTISRARAEQRVQAMCDKLLANTVIEHYRIAFTDGCDDAA